MAIYHGKFEYQNKTNLDFDLIVASFNAENGETDTFLDMETMSVENYDGTKHFDYGAKYNSVATFSVSLIKPDASTMTVSEVRSALKWLTGAKTVSWLNLYRHDNTIDYSFLGRFTDVKLEKQGSSVIGVIATFTSTSPWAYSDVKVENHIIDSTLELQIDNKTDDLYTYIYPKVIFENTSGDSLSIYNATIDETLELTNLVANEIITMDTNQIIYSDNSVKIFGDNFNYKWLRLAPGINNIVIHGHGSILIQYRCPIKIADAIVDIENMHNFCE